MMRSRTRLVARRIDFDGRFLDYLSNQLVRERPKVGAPIRNGPAITRKAKDVEKALRRFSRVFKNEIIALRRITDTYPKVVALDTRWRRSPPGPGISKRQFYFDLTALVTCSVYLHGRPDWKRIDAALSNIGRPIPRPRYYWQKFIAGKFGWSRNPQRPLDAAAIRVFNEVLSGAEAYLRFRQLCQGAKTNSFEVRNPADARYLEAAEGLLPGLAGRFSFWVRAPFPKSGRLVDY